MGVAILTPSTVWGVAWLGGGFANGTVAGGALVSLTVLSAVGVWAGIAVATWRGGLR